MSILLAINEEDFVGILTMHFSKADFDVVDTNVFHRNYLLEVIDIEKPSMLVLHDTYLTSDQITDAGRDAEMLQLIEHLRSKYDNNLRIVYLCERDRKDPFLGNLVARNVLDIFNEKHISTIQLIEQLKNEPKFSNVHRFGIGALEADFEEEKEQELEQVEVELDVPPQEDTPLQEDIKNDGQSAIDLPKESGRTKKLFSQLKEKTKNAVDSGVEWNTDRKSSKKERAAIAEEEEHALQAAKKAKELDRVNIEDSTSSPFGKKQSELDDVIDLMPIPKEIYNRNQIIGTVVIGVAGVRPHLGTTHTAMNIASYLSDAGHSVALIEVNHSEDFDRIHALYEGEKKFLRNQKVFQYSGIDHYKYRENMTLGEIMTTYEYVVLDVGAYKDSPVYEEYLRAHLRLIVVSPHEWKEHWTKEFCEQVTGEEFYHFIVPMANKKLVVDMEERFPNLNIVPSPVSSNPYEVNPEVEEFVEDVMSYYIKERKQSSSKKSIVFASLVSAFITMAAIGIFMYL